MRTRAEHLAWSKDRALAMVERHDYPQAIASILSDLGKHPQTEDIPNGFIGQMAAFEMLNPTYDGIKRFIEGIN